MELPEYTKASETLPNYTSSVNFYGLALLKTEFLTPYQGNNGNRSWKPVLLHMNSTQLNMYNINGDKKLQELLINLYFELNNLNQLTVDLNSDYKKANGVNFDTTPVDADDIFAEDAFGSGCKSIFNESKLGKLKNKLKAQKSNKTLATISSYYDILKDNQLLFEPSSGDISGTTFEKFKGSLLHSYSLTHLQVGEAPSLNHLISAMYKEDHSLSTSSMSALVKYKNTLRLRIEYKQVLLQFWSFHGMISWYRNLSIGQNLSFPLEMRSIGKSKPITSQYNRGNKALLDATAAAATYGRERFSSIESGTDEPRSAPESEVVSTDGEEDQIFDNSQYARRESAASSPSMLDGMGYVILNGYKFASKESFYTTNEKQYITNSIPDLNSFDTWFGKLLTISNAEFFVNENKKGKGDVLISSNALGDLVQQFDKKFANSNGVKTSSTRTFMVQRDGLVGVEQEN
ncbi:hypothetical protein I9W82_002448 [Candida metapsilosis]|uniref:Uncharacterized protein n=1 Tax=Candida metapsilosis TaxID=273372 RepID=A0A8H7ZEN3_9ASCO|nr:hypothetical protein I9W82_002448 [Candida metapsilosis]